MEATLVDDKRWHWFLAHLADVERRSDKQHEFSHDLWAELAVTGLFSTLADSRPQAGTSAALTRLRELGRASPDRGLTFSAVTQLASTVFCLRAFASAELQARYLPAAQAGDAIGGHAITEDGAGSDVMAMTTTAVRQGEQYVLTGAKKFITNAPVASTLVVYAKTEGDGHDGSLSAFLIETGWAGVKISAPMPTAGLRSSPIGEVHLTGVRVPEANRIGFSGAGMLILDQVMKREILWAFAANLGEMERTLQEAIAHVNHRKQFGSSIGTNQLVANRLVEPRIALELGGALLESIAAKIDGYEDVSIPIAAAKIFISEAHVACALNALQVHGGGGYLTTASLTGNLLDAVPSTIYSGSNDVLRTKIATMMGVLT